MAAINATQTKPKALAAFLSYRVATRRSGSTPFRPRYRCRSYSAGPPGPSAAGCPAPPRR
jgi:hypothetical protein